MKRKIITLSLALVIASCTTSAKQSLGLVRSSPDEFKVISQPDLVLPPDFDLIPPQFPVDSYQFNVNQAKPVSHISLSKGESEFLAKITLDKKDPNIRGILVNEQHHKDYTTDGSLTKKINSALKPEASKTKVVVAPEEKDRLKKNQLEGKPLTEGEVKATTKQKSVVEKILGE